MTSELTTIGRLRRFFVRMFGFQEVLELVGPRCPRCYSIDPDHAAHGDGDTEWWRCRRCRHQFSGPVGPCWMGEENLGPRCPECFAADPFHWVNGTDWTCEKCGHNWDEGPTLDAFLRPDS